jgi:hypothetical protein
VKNRACKNHKKIYILIAKPENLHSVKKEKFTIYIYQIGIRPITKKTDAKFFQPLVTLIFSTKINAKFFQPLVTLIFSIKNQ